MSFDKAIETLTQTNQPTSYQFNPHLKDALKIAVACITYVINIRRFPDQADSIPIPGEDPK